MVRPLTENECELCVAIVSWLKPDFVSRLAYDSPAADLLYDLAQSNYEIGCCALEAAGQFRSEGDYWRVLPDCDAGSLPDGFARDGLDHLLSALACHSHYATELYRHYAPVKPTGAALIRVCEALVRCGYMEKITATEFTWADDFGPWLVQHQAWSLTEFEAASEDDVQRTIGMIPREQLDWLSGSVCLHESEFVRCFFAHWFNDQWDDTSWRRHPNDDWDLSLAAGVYACLHSKADV